MDKLFQFWYNGAWILGKLKKNPIEERKISYEMLIWIKLFTIKKYFS